MLQGRDQSLFSKPSDGRCPETCSPSKTRSWWTQNSELWPGAQVQSGASQSHWKHVAQHLVMTLELVPTCPNQLHAEVLVSKESKVLDFIRTNFAELQLKEVHGLAHGTPWVEQFRQFFDAVAWLPDWSLTFFCDSLDISVGLLSSYDR